MLFGTDLGRRIVSPEEMLLSFLKAA